jgi:hypothetical protein
MKVQIRKLILTSITVLLFSGSLMHAASWVISPGQSLQAAIDAASAGDNITVQSGGYDENITITKGLDIRGVGVVAVTGNLTITDTSLPVYLADLDFGKVGANSISLSGADQDIRMDRCSLALAGDFSMTGGAFYGYKNSFTGDVTFNGTDWTFQRTTVEGDVTVTGASTSKFIASSAKNFSHTGGECTLFQSEVAMYTSVDVRPESAKSWIAYSTLCFTEVYGASEIVGNHFVLNEYAQMDFTMVGSIPSSSNNRDTEYVLSAENPMLAITNSGGLVSVRNNVFDYLPVIKLEDIEFEYVNNNGKYGYAATDYRFDFIARVGIHVLNGSGLTQVVNNTLYSQGVEQGILIAAVPGATEVRNNNVYAPLSSPFRSRSFFDKSGSRSTIDDKPGMFTEHANLLVTIDAFRDEFARYFYSHASLNGYSVTYYVSVVDLFGSPFAIECGNAQSVITHNFSHNSSPINGGLQSNNKTGTLIYANEEISSPQPYLTSDAAVVDQGSAELIYNDLDGSLNDIGAYGGHHYDPSGRTTTNPVILSGAVSPLYVKRGGSVTVDARAAVVAEP